MHLVHVDQEDLPVTDPGEQLQQFLDMGSPLLGLGLAQQLLDLLPRQVGLAQDAADGVSSRDQAERPEDPLLELLDRPVVSRQAQSGRGGVLYGSNDRFYLLLCRGGGWLPVALGAPAGAAVGQGVGAVSVLQVAPAQDRLVLPADVSGAGGGVELAGGDQVQGLETLPAARVRLVQRGPTQVLHRLLPLRRLHLDHPPAPRWVVVGAIAPPYPIPALRNGNSWFHPDRGLDQPESVRRCRTRDLAADATGGTALGPVTDNSCAVDMPGLPAPR